MGGRATLAHLVFAVGSGQFFLPFLMAGVMAILPSIGAELEASAVELSLIGAVYTLSLTIFHLIAGRIGDIFGRRRLFLIGFGLLIVMSGLMALAPNITVLLGLRFIQAAGTGIMNTSALAILVSATPPELRGRVLSISSVGLYLGISLGPPLAGMIADSLSWRWLFALLVPCALPAWMIMAFIIKGEWHDRPEDSFDWRGCITYAVSITLLATGATWIAGGWWAWVLIAAGLAGLILFVRTQLSSSSPLIDIRFLAHNRSMALGLLSAFVNFGSTFGGLFYFSMYLQIVMGYTPHHAGLLLSVQPAVQIFVAPLAGLLADRYGAERIATIGIALSGLSLLLAGRLDMATPLWQTIAIFLCGGCGIALFCSPNTVAIMESVDPPHIGQASGLIGTLRTLGMLMNMVIVSMTMLAYLGDSPATPDKAPLFVDALQFDFIIFGLLNLLAFALSLLRLVRKKAL